MDGIGFGVHTLPSRVLARRVVAWVVASVATCVAGVRVSVLKPNNIYSSFTNS